MEKLQLSQLRSPSAEEPDESVDEDEIQRFRELRQKMILLDKAEHGLLSQNHRSRRPLAQRYVKKEICQNHINLLSKCK